MSDVTRVMDLVKSIDQNRTQVSASNKDEVAVMRAMLNDDTYKVDVYGKSGVEGQYCPYEESRALAASILKGAANITSNEAIELANKYEFGKQDAIIMIGISKEFVNTYLETGRKLPLGGRATSDISIQRKIKEETVSSFPVKTGVNDDGSDKYEHTQGRVIPAHGSLKVSSPCPPWVGANK
jgi:hypothetical protein